MSSMIEALVSNFITGLVSDGTFSPWPTPHLMFLLTTCSLTTKLWNTGSRMEALVTAHTGKLHSPCENEKQATFSN